MDTVSTLVTHLSVSSLISHLMEKLASPLAALFAAATKKTSAKLYTPTFLQKVRLGEEVELLTVEQEQISPEKSICV